ncbi:hypothetical protein HDU98_006739 [Podochytrium sp. JEL0797]|nr:hypothetical protein HDU98_006739 [Podochytrium sp. JEL0797]
MLSLQILDFIVTAFLVKTIATFVLSRVHTAPSRCTSAERNCHAPPQQQNPESPRTCPLKATPQSGNGTCPRRQTHPLFNLPMRNHPFFQVVELEIPFLQQPDARASVSTNAPAQPKPQTSTPRTPTHSFTAEENHFKLTVDVPGFSRSQLTTTITDDTRQIKIEGKNETRGPVELVVIVPRLGDLQNVKAVLEDGVLTLVIPKLERDERLVDVLEGRSGEHTDPLVSETQKQNSVDGYDIIA